MWKRVDSVVQRTKDAVQVLRGSKKAVPMSATVSFYGSFGNIARDEVLAAGVPPRYLDGVIHTDYRRTAE